MNDSSYRLLVVDDNQAIHEDIRKTLLPGRSAGERRAMDELGAMLFEEEHRAGEGRCEFEIDSAYQGQEGLAMVARAVAEGRPYAIAVVDVRMPPGWDGIVTAARIWEVAADLQIVLCTAYSDHPWEQIVSQLGTRDNLLILKKPFDAIEVVQLAHALAAKWSAQRAMAQEMRSLEDRIHERTGLLQKISKQLKQEQSVRERLEKVQRSPAIAWPAELRATAGLIGESGELLQHSFDKLLRLLGSYRRILQSLVTHDGSATVVQSLRDAENQAGLAQLRTGIPEELRRIVDAAEHLLSLLEADSAT